MAYLEKKACKADLVLGKHKHIVQMLVAFTIKILGAVASFGLSVVIAREYGPSGAGAFGLLTTTLQLSATVCLVGLDFVLIRTIAGDLKENAKSLARGSINVVTKFTIMNSVVMWLILSFVVLPMMREFLGSTATSALYAATWGVIPVLAIRIVSAVLRGSGRVLLGQILDGPVSTGLTLVALSLWAVAGRPTIVTAGQLYVTMIMATVVVGALVGLKDVVSWGAPRQQSLKPMLASGWKIALIVLIGWSVDWLILMALARHRSTADVGLYRTAWQFASLFSVLVIATEAVMGPRIAAAWRLKDRGSVRSIYRQTSLILTFLALPLLLVCLVFPQWLLGFFGPEFEAGTPVLRVLAFAQFISVATGPTGSILIMTGNERSALYIALSSILLAALLIMLIIPIYGLLGAALTSACAIILRNSLSLWKVWRILYRNSEALLPV